MKKAKKPLTMHAGSLTVGPFKKVTYYQADIEGPDAELDMIMNMVNNKFELPSTNKTLKPQKKKQAKVKRGVLVDPPSGWQYGFPARYIKEEHGTMEDFLRLKKYPEKDIAFAMQNMRHIGDE